MAWLPCTIWGGEAKELERVENCLSEKHTVQLEMGEKICYRMYSVVVNRGLEEAEDGGS